MVEEYMKILFKSWHLIENLHDDTILEFRYFTNKNNYEEYSLLGYNTM
jgi:hypothetical protein